MSEQLGLLIDHGEPVEVQKMHNEQTWSDLRMLCCSGAKLVVTTGMVGYIAYGTKDVARDPRLRAWYLSNRRHVTTRVREWGTKVSGPRSAEPITVEASAESFDEVFRQCEQRGLTQSGDVDWRPTETTPEDYYAV